MKITVVGRGMIGSAAARHLADSGHAVTLVGPIEPDSYDSTRPYSSHYDQGRVTRITAFDAPWGEWARASIDRYPEIAQRSGIEFHDPVGLVVMASTADRAAAAGAALGADTEMISAQTLMERTGIASVVPGHLVAFEGAPAGLINPLRLVAAQTACARQAGATVIDDVVTRVTKDATVETASGSTISGDRVLLCTGAYGAMLLGMDDEFPIERRLRTIVLADVGDGPDLPTMIIDDPPHPNLEEAYWVPPLEFPSGRHLLKIGGDSIPKLTASSNDEITAWFASGGSVDEATALFELLETLLPNRQIERVEHRPCVVSYPPEGVPHIASVSNEIAVAFGGCGAAAKSSDEIGRLAAEQVLQGG